VRIVVLGIRGLPSTYSGLETIMSELAPRWVEAGHKVTVYCRRSLYDVRPAKWRGVDLRYLPSIEHKALSTLSHTALSTLHVVMRREPADVAFVWNAANGPLGWPLRIAKIPAVINVDGMEWLRPKWSGAARRYFRWAAQTATRAFPIVITDAEEMRRLYRAEFDADTRYVAYGAEVQSGSTPKHLDQYGLEPGSYYLIASRLIPDNNADVIIEGFVASSTKRALVVAGGADYAGNTVERAFAARLRDLADDRVRFLGHVNDSDHIRELHQHCYAYVHGHQYGGINPSLLKALGYGNCVLALDTPFNREVLADGEYGALFARDPASVTALINAIDYDEQRAATMRDRAPQRILERFRWDDVAQEYLDIFKEAVAR
jgi:glycosyltransferase involved in cell wall biosynthesis